MSPSILWFREIAHEQAAHVGGKGLNLGLMTAAGLPVPPGFVITESAYRLAKGAIQQQLSEEIRAAYEQLGRELVAVRSSAIGEDGADFSFAGQQETILGVEGDEALIAAIERCWQSLHGERAIAYRRANKIDDASAAMAVVVQRLVPSEVSGVLFTRDPLDVSGKQLLVEAAPGLGEAVVSGRVMPDRYHVERETGRVVDQHVSRKKERLSATGWSRIPGDEQQQPCLSPHQLAELAKLSAQIESYYGEPRDVEWAFANGQFYVLQARPITAVGAAEIEQVRRDEINRVQQLAGGREVIWARYNLAEVLPTPTPLTWSIVKRFMSGKGGFGQMFRSLGYDPDPELDEAGFIDLICGRPYVNLDREPKLFFRDFPYGYDFAAIREKPESGMYPKLVTVPSRKTGRFWWRLPMIAWRMLYSDGIIRGLLRHDEEANRLFWFRFPEFAEEVADRAESRQLNALTMPELLEEFEFWERRTLDEFAVNALKPGVLAATLLAALTQLLEKAGAAQPESAARRLVTGTGTQTSELGSDLHALFIGKMTTEEFLQDCGHRGPGEMELANPRWRERPDLLPKQGDLQTVAPEIPKLEDVVDLKKNAAMRSALESAANSARVMMSLRETAKHQFMRGYSRIRDVVVEIGRRTGLADDVFFLEQSELRNAIEGESLQSLILERKRRRRILLTLPCPPVLFSDDLEAIGRPIPVQGAAEWSATPLSFGEFEGPALVLEEPINADNVTPGFVLVCPSTDPAWVPLFLKAGALVMESGGVLSHGAIVAREFGIPAVAGIANVHRRLQTGQQLKVDGSSGKVHVFDFDPTKGKTPRQ